MLVKKFVEVDVEARMISLLYELVGGTNGII